MLSLRILAFLINTILSKNLLVELAEDKNRTSGELGTEYKSLNSVLEKTIREVQEEMKEEMEGDNANMAIMMVI